jgi:erythromycin esterase-like protein
MNCTQETYYRCLATVAPREVAAARANGAYAATWNSKKPNQTDMQLRATGMLALAMTIKTIDEVGAKTNVYKERMYALLAKMENDGLVRQRRVVIKGNSQSEWRLV